MKFLNKEVEKFNYLGKDSAEIPGCSEKFLSRICYIELNDGECILLTFKIKGIENPRYAISQDEIIEIMRGNCKTPEDFIEEIKSKFKDKKLHEIENIETDIWYEINGGSRHYINL